MSLIPKKGEYPNPVIPSPQVAEAMDGRASLEHLVPRNLIEYVRSLNPWREKRSRGEPSPPPKPPGKEEKVGGTYVTDEDGGEYPLSRIYGRLIKEMLLNNSRYPVRLRDREEMLKERKSDGYENGVGIEIASDLEGAEFAERFIHEDTALNILGKNRYPGDHDERHDEIIAEGKRRFKAYMSAMMN